MAFLAQDEGMNPQSGMSNYQMISDECILTLFDEFSSYPMSSPCSSWIDVTMMRYQMHLITDN
jgi:hypothetical protein